MQSPPARATTPPIVNNDNGIENNDNGIEPPAPNANARPASGVTESQADAQTRATQVLSTAASQADRLKRESVGSAAQRADVDAALQNLRTKRMKVLQDLRELEIAPGSADIRMELEKDVDALEQALRASYAIAPETTDVSPTPRMSIPAPH
jgi:hypothetical protein